ncbi:MAG: helix-turn-helix domain-containing protein [Microcella pacifica]
MTENTAASSPLINGANATVAANIRAELGRYGKQQGDLARALNVSAMYLSRRMNSAPAFDVHEVVAIANYFGIEPGDLFTPVAKNDLQITNR